LTIEERKTKKGKRSLAWSVGAKEFSIFVFLFSFLPLVSVPLRGKEGAGPVQFQEFQGIEE
jgi:hypothetical protein